MSIGGTSAGIPQRAIGEFYPPRKNKTTARRIFGVDKLVLTLVALYLLIPLGATLWFGLDTGKGFDPSTYLRIFKDPDLSQTIITSLELALGATILVVVLVTPPASWVQLRIPGARPLLDFLSPLPFPTPPISLPLHFLPHTHAYLRPSITS